MSSASISGSSVGSPFNLGSDASYQVGSNANSIVGTDVHGDTLVLGSVYGYNAVTLTAASGDTITDAHAASGTNSGDTISVDGGSGNTINASGNAATIDLSSDHGDSVLVASGSASGYASPHGANAYAADGDATVLSLSGSVEDTVTDLGASPETITISLCRRLTFRPTTTPDWESPCPATGDRPPMSGPTALKKAPERP